MLPFFSHFVGDTVGSTLLLSLAVMFCAFFLEDVTTLIVGVLAADGIIPVPIAIISLYAGILAGDVVLYSIGRLARTHQRFAHYVDHKFTTSFRAWLEGRYAMVIFSGHFVPGLRFTTYIASGFFRFPLSRYIPMAVASGLILETVIFTVSYLFGSFSSTWMKELRWGIAAVFILALFFIARHNIRSYRAAQNNPAVSDSGADTPQESGEKGQ